MRLAFKRRHVDLAAQRGNEKAIGTSQYRSSPSRWKILCSLNVNDDVKIALEARRECPPHRCLNERNREPSLIPAGIFSLMRLSFFHAPFAPTFLTRFLDDFAQHRGSADTFARRGKIRAN